MLDDPPAVLLDFYDTLAWIDWPAVREGRTRLAEAAGADPGCLLERWDRTVAERTLGRLGPPADELAQLLAGCQTSAGPGRLAELLALDRETWRRCVRAYEDALDGLQRLRGRGCRLAIVSNCSWQGREAIRALGIDREVDLAVLSSEVGACKPDPAVFRLALDGLGVPAEAAVLVDDVPENLEAARELGLRGLLMDRRGRSPESGSPRVTSLAEVEAALFPTG
jgi:putative hydrolase of the HAD superfamily